MMILKVIILLYTVEAYFVSFVDSWIIEIEVKLIVMIKQENQKGRHLEFG